MDLYIQACSHTHSLFFTNSLLELHKRFGCSRLPRIHMIVHADQRRAKYLTNAHWQSGPVRILYSQSGPVRLVRSEIYTLPCSCSGDSVQTSVQTSDKTSAVKSRSSLCRSVGYPAPSWTIQSMIYGETLATSTMNGKSLFEICTSSVKHGCL